MPDSFELMGNLGLPVPGASSTGTDTQSNSASVEDVVSNLWQKPQESTQPGGQQQNANGQQPSQTDGTQQGTNQGQQQSNQQVSFEDASKKAFLTDSGEFDSQRFNDFFLTNGKALAKYEALAPVQQPGTTQQPTEQQKADPKAEWDRAMEHLSDNYDEILNELQQKNGLTLEQAHLQVQAYVKQERQKYSEALAVKKAVEEQVKQYAPELERIRAEKEDALINRHVAELSTQLEGLIPGVNGVNALNKLVLDRKYGGEYVEYLFNKENPTAASMPQADRDQLVNKFMRNLQSDRAALGFIAEFGRMRWMTEQLPSIIRHGQQEALRINQTAAETRGAAPSGINPGTPRQASGLSKFFGY